MSELGPASGSGSGEAMAWLDRWWMLLVILFGLAFVALLVTFSPTW